jgi:hypothetical protein
MTLIDLVAECLEFLAKGWEREVGWAGFLPFEFKVCKILN